MLKLRWAIVHYVYMGWPPYLQLPKPAYCIAGLGLYRMAIRYGLPRYCIYTSYYWELHAGLDVGWDDVVATCTYRHRYSSTTVIPALTLQAIIVASQ